MGSSNGWSSSGPYEVFLSFRGPDTRQGFVSVLFNLLSNAKIRVFMDDEGLRMGDKIDSIFDVIVNSKICIPIFSPNFVQSKYCMREVTRMVELKKTIVPIFYHVTTDDVKLKTPLYSNVLRQYEDASGYDEVQMWKQSFTEVVSNKGKTLDARRGHQNYMEFCKEIVAEIKSILRLRSSSSPDQQAAPAPAVTTFGAPVTVVGKEFVAPYPIDLAMVRKLMTCTEGSFDVTDSNGTDVFKVKAHYFTMHHRRELLDLSGNTLLTLHQNVLSMHDRWRAYRGESTDDKDLLFITKRSRAFQFHTKLQVYVGQNPNPNEDVWDYRVDGSWSEGSCAIYAGNTNDIVAQIQKKATVLSALVGKDHFNVTVHPDIDYAFMVALVVIFASIK